MVSVIHSHEHEIPESIYDFTSKLIKSTNTGRENIILSVMLGGSHSKWLQNSRSDVDLQLIYTTNARNLVSFNRVTLSIVPKDRFRQTKSEPVLYEYRGVQYELDTVPARRVGEGNDLFNNLRKCNMHTIHSLLKDYPVALDIAPVWAREFGRLIDIFRNEEYDLSIEAVVGYFRGYMVSQLRSHRRSGDFGKREMKALKTYDPSPVVKAIMNGMYIGLSGIILLDERSVSRDFYRLWKHYEYLFTEKEQEFIEQCYQHKTDREHITKHVDRFLADSAKQRDAIFNKLSQQFDISKGLALRDGRFKIEANQKKNNEILDQFQYRFLGL